MGNTLNPFSNVKEPTVTRQRDLTVATLNYCGIAFSPFQFYFKQHELALHAISYLFKKLIPHYVPNFDEKKFKWKMGDIEKHFKKGRYSHMFDVDVGIFWKRFITRKAFEEKWDLQFQKNIGRFELKWTIEERETVRLYDFIMYHTLLAFVYNNQNFEEAIQNDPETFVKRLKPLYQISFLNQERKLDKFLSGLLTLKADVFFIQEYSQVLFDDLSLRDKKFHVTVDSRKDSLVLLNKESFTTIKEFKEVTQLINEEQQKNLRWAQSIAVVSADNYIFGCVHLSSKKQKNGQQVVNLKEDLLKLRQALPSYELIIGGDINSFMPTDPTFSNKFDLYPRYEFEHTTIKKRTYSQAQYHKGEEKVIQSKDRIISSVGILEGGVQFLDGNKADAASYLPTHDHPHDHFLVTAKIGSKRV